MHEGSECPLWSCSWCTTQIYAILPDAGKRLISSAALTTGQLGNTILHSLLSSGPGWEILTNGPFYDSWHWIIFFFKSIVSVMKDDPTVSPAFLCSKGGWWIPNNMCMCIFFELFPNKVRTRKYMKGEGLVTALARPYFRRRETSRKRIEASNVEGAKDGNGSQSWYSREHPQKSQNRKTRYGCLG